MDYVFDAKIFFSEDENGVLVVAFADDEQEPQKSVLIQKTLEPDEQDRELGLDKSHIEIAGQSRSTYGGISSINVSLDGVEIHLNEAAKEKLGIEGVLKIKKINSKVDLALIAQNLQRLADGEFLINVDL